MLKVYKAIDIACAAHEGQFRKYSENVPYIVHPGRVASRVARLYESNEDMVCAAWLHDVVEDTQVTLAEIEAACGAEVATLVDWLTNPSKGSKKLRADRKSWDREHIAKAPAQAKMIKLADRADNLRDLLKAPLNFAELYHSESVALFDVLKGTHPILEQEYILALTALATSIYKKKQAQCSAPSTPTSQPTTPTP